MLIESQKKVGSGPLKVSRNTFRKMKDIYEMLRQHYVQRKSVVFIVDSQFEINDKFKGKINEMVKTYFKELDDQDYFGFISLSPEFE